MSNKKAVNLTTRDMEIVRFMEETGLPLSASQVSKIWFWSGNEKSALVCAQRRLLALYRCKKILRIREYVGQEYIYYLNKVPNQLKHKQLMIDFLCQLNMNNFKVLDVQVEWKAIEKSYGVRPDLFLTVEFSGKQYNLICEVENTKEFDSKKYEKLTSNINTEKSLHTIIPNPMLIVAICKEKPNPIKRANGLYTPVWIKADDFS
ncbi:MAG: hypothetical protein J6D33_00830, partial [Turicibacter sp.]|nr:hypothetical protein [Turicibacter sp.]